MKYGKKPLINVERGRRKARGRRGEKNFLSPSPQDRINHMAEAAYATGMTQVNLLTCEQRDLLPW